MKRFSWVLLALVACGDDSTLVDAGDVDAGVDASFDAFDPADAGPVDADTDAFDVGTDATNDAGTDSALDAAPAMGFGQIEGPCPRILDELETTSPSFFVTRLDFMDDPFDRPEDEDLLTEGGLQVLVDPTLGGSSDVSEAFAYEVLERCDGAGLLETETFIEYMPTPGPSTDILVELEDLKIGVSVTRAVGFPRDDPWDVTRGEGLLTDKLTDVLGSTARVSDVDRWVKQILVVMAYEDMHAESLRTAWESLDDDVRADTIVYVVITDGMDGPIYGD